MAKHECRNTGVTIHSAEKRDFQACAELFKQVYLAEFSRNFFLRGLRKPRCQAMFFAVMILVYATSFSVTLTLISLCISLYLFSVYLHRRVSRFVNKQRDVMNIEKYYASDRSNYWVAKSVDGVIVGTVAILETKNKDVAMLKRLVIKKEFQSQGLGIRLVEHALNFCQEARYKEVKLICSECLPRALKLYRKLGFSAVPREKWLTAISYDCILELNQVN
ncbi:N-acetylaspartate synthetase-like [Anneissia japonica]|uniref:N-acetylaspartate synthetase-like n=1 Tax=Anneissia japonica TaxID=1529436 RepID=UPI00142558CE|nr:N-acetylaspartate synthetase-like [Anneissia japonica]